MSAKSKKRAKSNETEGTAIEASATTKSRPTLAIRERSDYNPKQQLILKAIAHNMTKAVFVDGLFGTSKTFLAVLGALRLYNAGQIDKVLYVRSPVYSGAEVGYLPGDLTEKMASFNMPFYDKLHEFLSTGQITQLEKSGAIECTPLSFIRGSSWSKTAVIVDEASSLTFADLILVMSRIGKDSKILIIGDSINQSDIGNRAGFDRMFKIFNDATSKEQGIHAYEMKEESDIVRSDFIKFVMRKTGMLK